MLFLWMFYRFLKSNTLGPRQGFCWRFLKIILPVSCLAVGLSKHRVSSWLSLVAFVCLGICPLGFGFAMISHSPFYPQLVMALLSWPSPQVTFFSGSASQGPWVLLIFPKSWLWFHWFPSDVFLIFALFCSPLFFPFCLLWYRFVVVVLVFPFFLFPNSVCTVGCSSVTTVC